MVLVCQKQEKISSALQTSNVFHRLHLQIKFGLHRDCRFISRDNSDKQSFHA